MGVPPSEVQLAPDETLVLYSDGVTEATSDEDEEFGEARLIDTLRTHCDLPVSSLLETIIATVQEYSGWEQEDDITLIVARCRSYQHKATEPRATMCPQRSHSSVAMTPSPVGSLWTNGQRLFPDQPVSELRVIHQESPRWQKGRYPRLEERIRSTRGWICRRHQTNACLKFCWTPATETTLSWSICSAPSRRAGWRPGRQRAVHPSRSCSHTST